jgi:hypothetical protein
MSETIIGFKGFDKDLKCNGFQYAIGKEYEKSGDIKLCEKGFHFCENPLDVFNYYPPVDSKFAEIVASGSFIKQKDGDSKVVCSRINIKAELSLPGIIACGVKFILDKVDWKNAKESNTGDYSAATNTGNRSAATNTGNRSAATNTGNKSAATNTGNRSAATNTGNRSAATNTGDYSAATNTGDYSAATNTGNRSAATNTGDYSAATNTGNKSAATNTGFQSAATVSGKDSIACGLGIENKAKGSLGCWLVLAERVYKKNEWTLKEVKTVKVDGRKIKTDTWYVLKKGRFVKESK